MRGLVTYDEGKTSTRLNRVSLSETKQGFDEAWLQDIMHTNPDLIPLTISPQERGPTSLFAVN